jgi:hypothetical protein
MFNPHFFGNEIAQFADSVSESVLLTKFIEDTENMSGIDDIISKWNTINIGEILGDKKEINVNNSDLNEPRSLYIVNSIYSGIKFCTNRYMEMKNLPDESNVSKNIILEKHQSGTEIDSAIQYKDNNKYRALVFFNDDYEGGEVVFEKQHIQFKPLAGSIVVFPNREDFQFKLNKINSGNRYIVVHNWSN